MKETGVSVKSRAARLVTVKRASGIRRRKLELVTKNFSAMTFDLVFLTA